MKPVDRLGLTIEDLRHAATHWQAFHRSLADITPDGYAADVRPAPHGGGIGNPTPGAVAARSRSTARWAEAEALVFEAQSIARRLAVITSSVGLAPPDSTQRCSGAPDQPWGRADCVNNSVRAGLCWACIKRGQRWSEEHDVSFT